MWAQIPPSIVHYHVGDSNFILWTINPWGLWIHNSIAKSAQIWDLPWLFSPSSCTCLKGQIIKYGLELTLKSLILVCNRPSSSFKQKYMSNKKGLWWSVSKVPIDVKSWRLYLLTRIHRSDSVLEWRCVKNLFRSFSAYCTELT